VIRVADTLCPDVVGIGELREFRIPAGVITFPEGTHLAFDPNHPHERLHIILTPAYREQVRMQMKHASPIVPIQSIARSAGGTHVRYPLPNVQGTPLGVLESVTYFTFKVGDGTEPCLYEHTFGQEHSKGVRPMLAADVSGRMWVCGGSYTCPLAGITG
jgi:hypothetical protein